MTTLATLVVKIVGDISEYTDAINKSQEMTSSFSDKAVNGLSAIGGGIVMGALAAGAAAVTGLGVAAWTAGNTVDEAMDTIITKTGATGDALDGLEGSFKNVFSKVPTDANTAAEVIAALNSRLELTGPLLEENSVKLLQMSKLLGGDAQTNAGLFARVIGDWSVPLADSSTLLDKLFVASQQTGVGVDSLMTNIVQFGAPMRNMGFQIDDAIALFAKWEKEGVNAELVMGSLRIAAGKFADEQKPLREGLEETMKAIKGAATNSEALSIAMGVFGARAAGDMAAAIREGRFDIEDLTKAMDGATGAIDKTAKATMDWPEKWALFTNGLMVSLAPLGQAMMDLTGKAMDMLNAFLAKPEVQMFISDLAANIQSLADSAGAGLSQLSTWFQAAFGWLMENQGVIVAALAMVGVAVLAFAYTSLAAAIPAIIGFIAAWWPVILVLGLVGAAAYLLYTAWTENWGGIREITAAVWAWLEPILMQIVTWFQTNIPLALQAVANFWNQKLVPMFQDMVAWLQVNGPKAVQTLADAWNNELLPAMTAVQGWSDAHLIPMFKELAELAGHLLVLSLTGLTAAWNVLKGPLGEVAEMVENYVVWAFGNLMSILETVATYMGGYVAWAFGNLTSIIDGVTWAIGQLNDALSNISLPEDLTPGSPTPFEMGLRGIGDALDALNGAQLPTFKTNLELQPVGIGAASASMAGAASSGFGTPLKSAGQGGKADMEMVIQLLRQIAGKSELSEDGLARAVRNTDLRTAR